MFLDKEVARFRLSERVPPHNLYRRLAELVDWSFLHDETRALYSHTGQPSLDPVVFFKLVLVGRLENLVSDRRLVEHCALRLDILYFLGYEVDEELPWHSTVSRTRQLFPAAVFERLFDHVFAQCVAAGLVTGHIQAVDSAFVKANASLESLCEKQLADAPAPVLQVADRLAPVAPAAPPAGLISSPAHQLQRVATTHARYLRNNSGPLGRSRLQARLLSNKTHHSPADPEARIPVKPGKARALNYLCSMAMDEGTGVISHIQADFADRRDSVLLESIVAPLHQRLLAHDLPVWEVVADTLPAGLASCCHSRVLTRARTVGYQRYTVPLAGTAACARISRPVSQGSRSGNSFAPPTRPTTAAPLLGSRAAKASACAGCGSAQ